LSKFSGVIIRCLRVFAVSNLGGLGAYSLYIYNVLRP
jgi:hypothetical protein